MSAEFNVFWAAYPRKVGKGDARKAFTVAIRKTTIDVMLRALSWQRNQPQWTKDHGQYIPYAGGWLRSERWDDEPFHAPPESRVTRHVVLGMDQRQRMDERDRLIASGLSKDEANKAVGW